MAATAKEAARQILEHLPDQATWNDIMYELYVKQKMEEGLADIEAGRTIPHEELKTEILGNAGLTIPNSVTKSRHFLSKDI